jgi:exosome complex component MTR3
MAASVALADAGIEMLGLVAATSACSIPLLNKQDAEDSISVDKDDEPSAPDSVIWLDPTADECTGADGSVVFACMPALNTATNVFQTGTMSIAVVSEVHVLIMVLEHHFWPFMLIVCRHLYRY